MSLGFRRRPHRWGLRLMGAIAAALISTPSAAALAAASGSSLPDRRVISLTPRVVTLKPRIISVAPAQPAPNHFTVNSDVLFAFDSYALSAAAQAVLRSVVQQLKKAGPGRVLVVGYTDSIGDPSYNLTLSQNRSNAVTAYLRQTVGNSALAYRAQGQGEANPVAPNTLPDGQDNPVGRAQNRRVTITYTPG